MLCPSSKLAVRLLMNTPVSTMAGEKSRDALPVSLLRPYSFLPCAAVQEGLRGVQRALLSVAIW